MSKLAQQIIEDVVAMTRNPPKDPEGVAELGADAEAAVDALLKRPDLIERSTNSLGRKFIGIEIEPRYFDIACKRISKEYEQLKLFPPEEKRETNQPELEGLNAE